MRALAELTIAIECSGHLLGCPGRDGNGRNRHCLHWEEGDGPCCDCEIPEPHWIGLL